MKSYGILCRALAAAIVAISLAEGTAAAQTSATVSGTVVDGQTLAVGSAQISLTRDGSSSASTTVTDSSGHFTFSGILPGRYQLRVSAKGFQEFTKPIDTARDQVDLSIALTLMPVQSDINVAGASSGITTFGQKSGIALDQMPQSVQVIDNEEIASSGARSIDDVLSEVPSAAVSSNRFASADYDVLKIRGFQAYEMINGMMQRYYGSVDPSALSNVEEVQVLKGPSSLLYGQAGVGGIISIITKQPTQALQGSVAYTIGMYGQNVGTLDLGGPVTKTLSFRLTGEIERSGSFIDHMDLGRENAGLTLAWRPRRWVSAHVVTEYLDGRTQNYPGLPTIGTVISNGVATVPKSAFLGEPGFNTQDNRSPLLQTWIDFKLPGDWTLTPRAQFSEFDNLGLATNLLTPVTGDPTLIQRQGLNGAEHDQFYVNQVDLSGHVTTLGVNHRLLLGTQYSLDEVNYRRRGVVPCGIGPIDALNPVYGCGPPTTNFAFYAPNHLYTFAFYVQDQIALTKAWNVVAGIRHSESDNHNAFNGTPNSATFHNISWQLGTTYALGAGFSLFGGYNTGYDTEWVTGAHQANGTPFQPETSDQAEGGLRLKHDKVQATLSGFRLRRNNTAVPDPANPGFQIQQGQQRVEGAELEGAWTPVRNWTLAAGYAYLDGIVSRSTTPGLQGATLAETPANSGSVSTRVTLGRVELRGGVRAVGARKMISGGSITLPSYATVNLGASTSFRSVRVEAALTNALDHLYYYSDNASVFSLGTQNRVIPGQPITLSVRIRYSFGANSVK